MNIKSIYSLLLAEVRRIFGYQMPKLGPVGYWVFSKISLSNVKTELLPGIHAYMDLNDHVQKSIFWHGLRSEPYLRNNIIRLSNNPEIKSFIDIGANYGHFSYLVATTRPEIEIYSFEPNPYNFINIKNIIELNNLKTIHPENIGLGANPSTIDFYIDGINSGNCSFVKNHPFRIFENMNCIQSEVKKFDDWYEFSKLNFGYGEMLVKIDVEGFEYEVLKGMEKSLEKMLFNALIIEIFPETLKSAGTSPKKIFSYLIGKDYIPHTEQDLSIIKSSEISENCNVIFLPKKKI